MAKSKNRDWIRQHLRDPYVQQSQHDGFRSRASYKLLEILEKDPLLRPGMCVVDLGAAPGGWSQVVAERVGPEGSVVALDLLPMEPIAGVDILLGDFTEDAVLEQLLQRVADRGVDLVISDMAPNVTGVRAVSYTHLTLPTTD